MAGFIPLLVATIMVMMMSLQQRGAESYSICSMTDDGLNACKPWVTPPGPAEPPSAACCAALSAADLPCLCLQKRNDAVMLSLLGIDPDLAMALPPKCNLPLPLNC
ncbi:unnamed protein product [Cuscuta campestris]|nr:unnamed protein product [Cuscuta campestris]